MFHKTFVLGNLGKDPEVRYSSDGTCFATFSVAASEKWKDRSGDMKERTEWYNCVAAGKLGEVVHEYVRKGATVFVEGRMQTRKWQDKDGNDRYSTELRVDRLQMVGGKRQDNAADEPVFNPDDDPPF